MSELARKNCVPCRGGVPPLAGNGIAELLGQLDGWNVEKEHHLTKAYAFPDFAEALAFVNRVGAIADRQGHLHDLHLAWRMVGVKVWTNKIDGLT